MSHPQQNIPTEITAPYNFVPLSAWIYHPDWAHQVSHDIPFEDGVSGTLELEITAHTPVLVGGKQEKASKNAPGKVHFCKIGEQYAIPGTSLKGMIRNVLEIASFGKMGYVDERRLGIRDISGRRVAPAYMENVKGQKAGFLRLRKETLKQKSEDGKTEDLSIAEIMPCEYVHVSHREMEKHINQKPFLFIRGMSVPQKYKKWNELTGHKDRNLPNIQFDISHPADSLAVAVGLGYGKHNGQFVFTGQISDKRPGRDGRPNKSGKCRDFLFYDRKSDTVSVPKNVLADFRFIHGDDDSNHDGPWRHFWKARFFKGEDVPVFYHLDNDGNVQSIGLAFMYRLAYKNSIAETIAHTNPFHHPASIAKYGLEDESDLADLLFGKVDDAGKNSLKSRVSFSNAQVQGQVQEMALEPTILNGPKPTYFPNYIRQAKALNNRLPGATPYTTYMDNAAEIRGWKRYPVRNGYAIQKPTAQQADNKAVQVQLFPLPENTVFTGKVRFHNLKREELGALVWALTWGNDESLRHALGMGKPFGLGQISIRIAGGQVRSNEPPFAETPVNVAQICEDFVAHMNEAFEKAQQGNPIVNWLESEQLTQLCEMANPQSPSADPNKLRHMRLDVPKPNDFVEAKKAGLALPDYRRDFPDNHKDQKLFQRRSIVGWQRQKAEQEAQRLETMRREKEAAEKAERLEQMSPLEISMEEVLETVQPGQKPYTALLQALESGKWEDADEKRQVAERIKALMVESKDWREKSEKKNPNKDKPYQVTLKVIKLL
jgi:CRISPR-associated protein (TIGR03986 family)